jgi:hypothetical protein
MRVLVVTPLLRDAVTQRTALYGRPLQSIFNLRWPGQLDHYLPNGGDSGRGNDNVTRKYADARCVALEGDYDAMLCAESDMLVPADGLEKLAALDVQVAYGLYAMRHKELAWCAATELTEMKWRSLSADPDQARAVWGQVVDVKGVGLGFTLIRRDVFEAVPFRNWRGVSNDWAFGCDCQGLGIRQVCHLGVVCGHFSPLPSPRYLYPDPDAPTLTRIDLV